MKPQDFIALIGPAAQASQLQTSIPASFVVAQAALESGWGESGLAKRAKNLFGIKADRSWAGPRITTDHDTRKTQLQRLWRPPKASAVPVAVSPDSPNSQSVPADLRTGADSMRDSTSSSSPGPVPTYAQLATGADAAAAHAVPDPASAQLPVSCEQLASDAAEATLMVLSFQRWYAEQAKAAEKP